MKTLLLTSITAIAALATPVQLGAEEDKSSGQQKQRQSSSQSGSKGSKRTKVALNQLPKAVRNTFRSEAGHLNIENVQKLNKNGQTCYIGTFDKGGLQSQLTVDEDGSLLQLQQAANIAIVSQAPPLGSSEMKLNDLPESVQSRVEQVAGTNKVGEISKVDQSGKTLYTAAFNDAGVHTELIFDDQGKLVLRTDQTALFAAPLLSSQPVSIQTAPKAVQNTIQQQASAGTVADIDKGQWNGKTAYRVMIERNGFARPMLISENGEILQAGRTATGAPAASEKGQEQRERAEPQAQARRTHQRRGRRSPGISHFE